MIIVAGKIYVRPGERDRFVALSADAVVQARRSPGCCDYVVAADLIEADRVNVYERWESEEALHAFRGEGPGEDLSARIVRAEVSEYTVVPHEAAGHVTIEEAQRADAQEILDLQKQAYQSEAAIYNDYTLPPLTQTLPELEAEFDDHIFLKALLSGVLVGSVRARSEGGICYIGRLIVHPHHQGQGIGTQLMRAIEHRFASTARYELFTGHRSERNLALYDKLGYVEVKREDLAEGLTLVYLQKQ